MSARNDCNLLLLVTVWASFIANVSAAVAAGGPVEYPGMKVIVDAQGVQAPGYTFRDDCQKPSPWQAEWIWATGDAPEAAWFRKEVTLADAPQKVAAWLSADVKYQLYINGRLVSRGPVDIGRDYAGGETRRWFYDCRDLTPFFSRGKNVIAAKVYRQGTIGSVVSRGKPGFLFEAEITSPGQDKLTVKSDATWRALPVPVMESQQMPGFDDATWLAARVVADVWAPLVPSEIPPLMEARYPVARIEGLPDNKLLTKDGSFTVVFDRVLSGFPSLKIKGGKGAQVTIKAHQSTTMTLGSGEQTFEFPFMDEIVPSFTVGVSNVTEPLELLDVGAVFTSQPVAYRGAFECSDEGLNRIWNVSRWAVQICLQTHHLDSPNHQEPISDPGDYVIESMVNHYAFAQPWLTRQDIRKFAWILKDENYHNFHTSYSIAWLQMLMDYYDYTGDRSLVVEMSPYVHELLDTYASWRGTNGIISEAPNYMFMDWVTIGGFPCHHPPAVIGQGYLTALYYHGLEMASRVAALTGDPARVQKYAQLRGEIATAFNRELWVADKGRYRDGKPFQTSVKPYDWLPADKDIETFSPHVNLLAVLYDLAPKEQQAAIVEKVLSAKPLNTQPWFMHWVFQAIDHAGLFDAYGTAQMRRWQIVPETQSFREMWNSGDLSHGWCSTPLVQMSARVLGVTPTEPGFKTIAIRPEICDLNWAKGKVPTPHGDVAVSWTLGRDQWQLEVTIPSGTEADVTLPVSRFRHPGITMNGRKSVPVVHVASGTYHFEVAGQLKPLPKPIEAEINNNADENVPLKAAGTVIRIDGSTQGRTFEGIGALSAGVSSRLLLDYPQREREEVLDYLFKPKYGAGLQHLKVEIGGDINSTDGTEPSPARTREEMVHPKREYFERGYESWLMREARKRNPEIYLDVLQWGAPGWIGGSGSKRSKFYSQDNAEFITSFIRCMKKYSGLNIDYCGIWNETPHDTAWIKLLRRTLDQAGLERVGIVAADDYAEDGWQIVREMEQDSELRAAVARVGEHYRKTQSPANAQAIGCPLWMSEDGPWRGDWTGAETLARMFNRNYITGKYTKTIIWSLITSYYDVLPLPDSGPMLAKEPWSGHYEVQPALWVIAHTTQFTHPGWRYLDAGCGLLDGGSYVTLRSPGRAGDYSIILETTEARQPQTVQFQVQGLSGGSLHVWRSNSQAQFEQLPDLATTDGTFSVTLDPDAIYSLTTTAGQQKGRSLAPPSAEFPLPYADDFESYRPGKYARYFSDQGGVFEVARRPDGKGQCLRQVLETNGIDWPFHPTPEPYSLIGSAHWRDYEVSVSTLIETTGSVSVWGRIQASLQNAQPAKGYWLQIASDGQWQLHAFTNLLAAGTILVAPHQWHDLTLRFSGSAITALVDHRMIQTLQDHAFSHGMAGVGSGWNTALFDDFSLRPVANPDSLNSQTSGVAK